jgi:hypothetical protein
VLTSLAPLENFLLALGTSLLYVPIVSCKTCRGLEVLLLEATLMFGRYISTKITSSSTTAPHIRQRVVVKKCCCQKKLLFSDDTSVLRLHRQVLQLPTFDDPNGYPWFRSLNRCTLNFPHGQHTLRIQYFPKDTVFSIQPVGFGAREEELATIRVGTRVGTTQKTRMVVSAHEILVGKRRPVNADPSRTIVVNEVPTLNHEPFDDTVKDTLLVTRCLFVLQKLTGTKLTKVLARLGALFVCANFEEKK